MVECKRCGHIWASKVDKPVQCPKCKQYYYDRPREWVKESHTNIGQPEKEPEKKQTEEDIPKKVITFE